MQRATRHATGEASRPGHRAAAPSRPATQRLRDNQPLGWRPKRQAFRAAAASGARGVGSNTPAIVQQKLQLLEKLSTLDRGALASSIDRYEVESLVRPLEQARGMLPFEGEPAIDGKWQLVYSSVEAFRSSPFFWAFPSLVGGDRQLAAQVYAFTDSIPGADVGPAYQTISVASGVLVSEVELRVWPGVSGYVVTSSRLAAAGESDLELTVESTRVANSNVLPQLFDAVTVPVEQLLKQLRGSEAAKAAARVTYLDGQMRVTRTLPDNALFIYRRVL